MNTVRPSSGAEMTRLLEQQMSDRSDRAKLQAEIQRVGIQTHLREELLAPLTPVVSPLLDIRV